jgi:hypothetical protein
MLDAGRCVSGALCTIYSMVTTRNPAMSAHDRYRYLASLFPENVVPSDRE